MSQNPPENVVEVASHALLDSSKRLKCNRTPEAEARRIEAVRKALKGKPATPEQREKRAAGLRKAHAEGRIKIVRTPEQIQKVADKLRGRKRPAEMMEKIRLANTGKKRSAEVRAAMSAIGKQRWANGYTESHETKRKRVEATQKTKQERKQAGRIYTSKGSNGMLRGYKWSEEVIEKRAAPLRGRAQSKPLTAKGPEHHKAVHGLLRSAENKTYRFDNMSEFVRNHEHLFAPEDVVWNKRFHCRALKGLLTLTAKGNHTRGSWKGWTLVSYTETFYHGGDDLLDRSNSKL